MNTNVTMTLQADIVHYDKLGTKVAVIQSAGLEPNNRFKNLRVGKIEVKSLFYYKLCKNTTTVKNIYQIIMYTPPSPPFLLGGLNLLPNSQKRGVAIFTKKIN